MVFNENKMYKDLLTERSTSDHQSSDADSEFVELDDVPVEKVWSIPQRNDESRVEPPPPK